MNRINFQAAFADLESLVIKYGSTTVTMNASNFAAADTTGTTFPTGTSDATVLIQYFRGNYTLSKDFDIELGALLNDIIFTSKLETLGFDFVLGTNPKAIVENKIAGVLAKDRPNYGVLFRLYCQDITGGSFIKIYDNRLPIIYNSNKAEIYIGDKLHDLLTKEIRENMPDIPTTTHLVCNKTCRKYYFEFAESYGDPINTFRIYKSDTFTILHGGLSTLGEATKTIAQLLAPGPDRTADRFLKQGPPAVDTRTDQPQYLYFFNTRAATTVTVNCRYYFKDGSIAVIALETFSMAALQKVGLNVGFDHIYIPDDYPSKKVDKYEIWLTDNLSNIISESRFYILDYQFREYFKYFLNWSSWGTMDTRMFYGKGSVEFDLVQSEADKIQNPQNISYGKSLVYDTSIQTKLTTTTGFIKDRTLLLFNRDFYLSPLKYILFAGQLLPIKVTSKTISEIVDGENLYAQKFEYQYLFDDQAYTEGDVFTPPVILPPIVGSVYFGPVVVKPTTPAEIKALNSQSAGIYLFPVSTGMSRIIVVALPPGKLIGTVYDQTNDENITSEFKATNMTIDAMVYKINTMELAAAYSTSHTFIISLING
nr:hypothetical protein [Pedobacter sp. ASV19]